MFKYFLLLILTQLYFGKLVKHSTPIRSINDWHYISKFGAAVGEVTYTLT